MAGRVAAALIEARNKEYVRANSAFTGYHLQLDPPVSDVPRSDSVNSMDDNEYRSRKRLDEETGTAPGRLQQVTLLPDWPEDTLLEDESSEHSSAQQTPGISRRHSGPLTGLPKISITTKQLSRVAIRSMSVGPLIDDIAIKRIPRLLELPEHGKVQESDRSTNTSFSHHEDSPYTTPCDTPTYDLSTSDRSPKSPLEDSWPPSACETPKEGQKHKQKSWTGLLKTTAWSRLKVIGHKAQGRLLQLQRVSPISSSEATPSTSPRSIKSAPSAFRVRKPKGEQKLLALPAPPPPPQPTKLAPLTVQQKSVVTKPATAGPGLGILEEWECMLMDREPATSITGSSISDLSMESYQTTTQTDSTELRKLTSTRATCTAAPTPNSSPLHDDSKTCATTDTLEDERSSPRTAAAEPAETSAKHEPLPPLLQWSQRGHDARSADSKASLSTKSNTSKDGLTVGLCWEGPGVESLELSHQLLQLQRQKQRFQEREARSRLGEGLAAAMPAGESPWEILNYEVPDLAALPVAESAEDWKKPELVIDEGDNGTVDLVNRRVAVPRFQWEIVVGGKEEVEEVKPRQQEEEEVKEAMAIMRKVIKKSQSWSATDVQDAELQHMRASSCPSNLLFPGPEATRLLEKAKSRPMRHFQPLLLLEAPGHTRAKSVKSASELWAENSASTRKETPCTSAEDDSCGAQKDLEEMVTESTSTPITRSPSPQAGLRMNAEEAYLHLPKRDDCQVLREVIELVVKEMEEEGLPFQGLNRSSATGQSSDTATGDNEKPPSSEDDASSATGQGNGQWHSRNGTAVRDDDCHSISRTAEIGNCSELIRTSCGNCSSAVAAEKTVEQGGVEDNERVKVKEAAGMAARLERTEVCKEEEAMEEIEAAATEPSVSEEAVKKKGWAIAKALPVLSLEVVCGLSDSEGEDANGCPDEKNRSLTVQTYSVSGKDDAADFWGVHPEKLSPVVKEDWRGLLDLLEMGGGRGGVVGAGQDADDDNDDAASKTSSEGGLVYPTEVELSDAESLLVNPGSPRGAPSTVPVSNRPSDAVRSSSTSRIRQQTPLSSSRPLSSPFHSRSPSSHASYGSSIIVDPLQPPREYARKEGPPSPIATMMSNRSISSHQRYVRTLSHSFDAGTPRTPRELQGRSSSTSVYEHEMESKARAALEREKEYLMRVSRHLPMSPGRTRGRHASPPGPAQGWQSQSRGTSPGRWSGSPSRGPRRYGSPSYRSGGPTSDNSRPSSPAHHSSRSFGPGSSSPSKCCGGSYWEGYHCSQSDMNSMHMSSGRMLGGPRRVHAPNYDYPQEYAHADSQPDDRLGGGRPATRGRRVSFDMMSHPVQRSLSVDERRRDEVGISTNRGEPGYSNMDYMGTKYSVRGQSIGSFCRPTGERALYDMGGSLSGRRFFPGERTVW